MGAMGRSRGGMRPRRVLMAYRAVPVGVVNRRQVGGGVAMPGEGQALDEETLLRDVVANVYRLSREDRRVNRSQLVFWSVRPKKPKC